MAAGKKRRTKRALTSEEKEKRRVAKDAGQMQ